MLYCYINHHKNKNIGCGYHFYVDAKDMAFDPYFALGNFLAVDDDPTSEFLFPKYASSTYTSDYNVSSDAGK